jgi:hypothetical protein
LEIKPISTTDPKIGRSMFFFWNQLAHATGQTWRPFSGPATSDQKYPQIETMCTQWPYQCWNETRIDGQTLECIRDVPTICQ